MSESTAEAGTTTRDNWGPAAALTTDAQAFGHEPNARPVLQMFSSKTLGFRAIVDVLPLEKSARSVTV